HVAVMCVRSTGDHVTVTLSPPTAESAERAAFRPTTLMERVSRALEEAPGLSKKAARAAVKGRAEYVDLALDLLIAEGFVEARRDRQATRHYVRRPYRSEHDEQVSETDRVQGVRTVSNGVPDTGAGTVSRVPAPTGGGHEDTAPQRAEHQ